ncbi:hypothetical protein Tco_0775928 [Tanacetum coccineum]
MNDLGYKRFHGEKIDEGYKRDCEISIRKLKQDFNEWGGEVQKKEQAYNEEQYSAARRRMLSIPLGDTIARYSTSKAITPDLPIEEPDNSRNMGDEHLDTTSSIENLVPIPSEFEGIPTIRVMCLIVIINIDPILEEFAGELAHIAPIPPGIVEADFDPNDDTSSDDDSFENIEYVDASPSYIETIASRSDSFLEESDTYLSHLDNSLPEFNTFSDHTEETRSGSTTTHANYSLPEYDSFLFNIEPDQEGLISIDNSNNTLLELPEFESFHFDPSFPRPPPKPPDFCMRFTPILALKNAFVKPNEDFYLSETVLPLNDEEDDSFTFVMDFSPVSHLSRCLTFILLHWE